MAREESDYQVRSVNRAIDILERLALQPGQTLTQLAEALEMPKSTCFNIIQTLVSRGLLSQDVDTGRFRLGVTTVRIGGACLTQLDVRQVARPLMERLVEQSRETSILALLQEPGLDVIYIDKVISPEAVLLNSDLGRRDPAYCTALGKALLAQLPNDRLDRYLQTTRLQPYTARTITDPTALREHLRQVRRLGYAINDGEMDNDGGGIAAPVFDHAGQVAAAISTAVPRYRLTPERIQSLVTLVVQTATAVSRSMGAGHGAARSG